MFTIILLFKYHKDKIKKTANKVNIPAVPKERVL